ncbi:hypothetical protein DH2020_027579 [Rehmannia glutinosa]|uniref:Bifunctional inhibitor/plant lipid transfer protein/seed storage helical domain-containing protein n=1 Tax=Rehmannia glutinosa TaxID=99300 RepID=A0ABR0VXA7_REHGL
MASKGVTSIALLVLFNLLFFTMVTSTHVPCPPPPKMSSTYVPCPPAPKKAPSSGGGHVKPPSGKAKCPKDTLKLGVCAKLLNDLVSIVVGTPPKTPCCTLIRDLADLEAAVCLCTTIKANVLGVKLNSSLSLSLLLNYCGKKVPSGFECA